MNSLPLVTQPNTILHTASVDIDLSQASAYQVLGEQMIATMLSNNGIGLAAPQIGKNLNLFVIHKDISNTPNHLVLCNPNITFTSAKTNTMEEGCLSCPKIYCDVARPEKIRVKAYTLTGEKKVYKAKGMLAKVFQHEIDHLNATLIIDK